MTSDREDDDERSVPIDSSPLGKPENLLVWVERLRERAEAFQRTVEQEVPTTRALIEELLVRQAKRRRHGRRMD